MAAFIRNRTLTTSNKGTKSLFQAMWEKKSNLHNFHLFGCRSHVHIPENFRRKLNLKTKECIFLGYTEGVKVGVFKHVAIGQKFVPHDAIARGVRLNSKPLARRSLGYQGKKSTVEVNPKRPEEDPHELEVRSPTTGEDSITTQEYNNKSLMKHEEIPVRHPRQPLVRFKHKWDFTTQTKDKLEPLTAAKASGSVH